MNTQQTPANKASQSSGRDIHDDVPKDRKRHPEFVRALSAFAWPVTALAILAVLHAPLAGALNAIRSHIADLHRLKVGALELETNELRLPAAPADVAKALSELSATDIEKLLKHGYKDCNSKHIPSRQMEEVGIVHQEPGAKCATLDPRLGLHTRNYLFKLVAAEVGRSFEPDLEDE